MLRLVELFADMHHGHCTRPFNIVVRRWFLRHPAIRYSIPVCRHLNRINCTNRRRRCLRHRCRHFPELDVGFRESSTSQTSLRRHCQRWSASSPSPVYARQRCAVLRLQHSIKRAASSSLPCGGNVRYQCGSKAKNQNTHSATEVHLKM
jgi:hypothetical protein